mmetsp:Transcript_29952/g.85601  ORF Transcript_29952/g.85601 Transcript_29952/m.85601 type:complete len:238 (+) Transcript_29952:2243-2956(+)
MTHKRRLVQLDHLQKPRVPLYEQILLDQLLAAILDILVNLLGRIRHLREKVLEQRKEQRHIVGNQLRKIHVTNRAHEEHLLIRIWWLRALDRAARSQHAQDVAQTEVVVSLLAELLFAEGVEDAELLPEQVNEGVPHRGELDLHDSLAVRHHHGHAPEEHFQILWQLLPASVPRIHCDEVTHRAYQLDGGNLTWEHECLEVLPFGRADGFDLHRHDAEHLELDSVELVEAAPQTTRA